MMRRTCQTLSHGGRDACITFHDSSCVISTRQSYPPWLGFLGSHGNVSQLHTNKVLSSCMRIPEYSTTAHTLARLHSRFHTAPKTPPSTGKEKDPTETQATLDAHERQPKNKKTQAELDEELRLKMEGIVGDGGEAGVQYEDRVPVTMKRSVKNNMFRYI